MARREEGSALTFVINLLVSATLISCSAWLARRWPVAAGFLVALPLASMIVLPMAHLQHSDGGNSFLLARSILLALPVSLTFFVPFLLAPRLGLSFWQAYAAGCLVLPLSFLAYRLARGVIGPGD